MADKKVFVPIKIGNVSVHLWTVLLFCASLFFDFFEMIIISYCIVALHEMSHILVAKRCGVPIEGVAILPFGITMRTEDEYVLKPTEEIKICIAGPMCNFALAYLAYGIYGGAYREYIITSNVVMGIFNLLPALPLDGGRIMRALLVKKFGYIRSTSLAFTVTSFVAVLIGVFGVLIIWVTKFNFSFLIIGAFLVANITEEKKRANSIIMKDILYSRKKLAKGVSASENVVANLYERVKNVICRLSCDRYYIVYVVDEKGRILKEITETELIEKAAVYGININFKKIIEM